MNIDLGICEQCGENPATIQLTQLIGTQESHVRLCQSCAAEQGVSITSDGIDIDVKGMSGLNMFDEDEDGIEEALHFSDDPAEFEKEFEALEEQLHGGPIENPLKLAAPKKRTEKSCKRCGTTFIEFKNSGILGCVDCYSVFSKELSNILSQSSSNEVYAGKNYRDMAPKIASVSMLKKELKQAVKNEEFELAASIRDRIALLENIGR